MRWEYPELMRGRPWLVRSGMPSERAHDLGAAPRTRDVLLDGDLSFKDMLLSDKTMRGLQQGGFLRPSPIQHKAIPLGRCGFDLLVQSKSGTGKTCVFTVVSLEMLDPHLSKVQVLILAPTREIAFQIANVVRTVGKGVDGLRVSTFIGGIPLAADRRSLEGCHVAVGAPGRIKHLLTEGLLAVDAVRLLVLDEADKLMEDSFREDVSYIFSKLPGRKQVISASATYPPELEQFALRLMCHPLRVSPEGDAILLGVRQMVSLVAPHPSLLVLMRSKTAELLRILSSVPFKQCLVFSNYHSRAETICNELNKAGWPAAFTSAVLKQEQRLKVLESLKRLECRVLLSTDLSARGIDAENVDLVVNMDLPYDAATYLHRIGRAGRFGSRGIAVTVVDDGVELTQFRNMLFEVGGEQVERFPTEGLVGDLWDFESRGDVVRNLEGTYDYSKTRKKKEDCTEILTPKSDLQVIHDNRLVAPSSSIFNLTALEDLEKSLSEFQIDATGVEETFRVIKLKPLPEELLSRIHHLIAPQEPAPVLTSESESEESESESLETTCSDSEESCPESECQTCSDWYAVWYDQLLCTRHLRQQSYYINEMLNHC